MGKKVRANVKNEANQVEIHLSECLCKYPISRRHLDLGREGKEEEGEQIDITSNNMNKNPSLTYSHSHNTILTLPENSHLRIDASQSLILEEAEKARAVRDPEAKAVKSNTCEECGVTFKKHAYLLQHMLSHSPQCEALDPRERTPNAREVYISGGNYAINCKLFPGTVRGATMQWFSGLPTKTIHTVIDLATRFVSRFATNKAERLEVADLFDIKEAKRETLKKSRMFYWRYGPGK
ncbi:hypothetical protein CR513_43951, partial [Mucuna pruriens]